MIYPHPDALVIDSDAPEAEEARCLHPEVVPTSDPNWGRCTVCGDGTFPLTAFAAGEADLDEEGQAAPRKKRRKGTSPTARTLAECRKRGWIAQNVEQFVRFPPPGHRLDLFGVIDIVAIAPAGAVAPSSNCNTIGIQATASAAHHAHRRDKILAEPRAKAWVEAGNGLELWSWSKRGDRGARKLWTLRVEVFTAESWSAA